MEYEDLQNKVKLANRSSAILVLKTGDLSFIISSTVQIFYLGRSKYLGSVSLSTTVIWLLYCFLSKKTADYKGLNPRFQDQNSSRLICSNLITHILVFHWRYTAFKTQFEYMLWFEMSFDKK